MNRKTMGAWAGMLASVLFVGVFLIEGWLRSDYDLRRSFISELSLGARGWIQISNFLVLGVLMLIFTAGMRAVFAKGKASRSGPILLAIISLGFFLSGVFTMDPPLTPASEVSLSGTLHDLIGLVVFILMPTICFVYFRRFRDEAHWRPLQWWTLGVGIVGLGAVLIMILGLPNPPFDISNWIGIIQRAAVISFLAWVFTVGYRMRRIPE